MGTGQAESAIVLMGLYIGTITLIGLTIFVMWIMSLIDVIKSNFEGNNKMIWVILLIMVAPLAAILYQIIGKKQKIGAPEQKGHFIAEREQPHKGEEPKPF